jgi:long-subunit fatty acid transport protein
MKTKRVAFKVFVLILFFLTGVVCTPSRAVVLGPDVLGVDFRFNNPGARANAMGGAFIGMADDATAAYTNPAGLTILTQSECSIEYKIGETTTKITDKVGTQEFDDSFSGISFLSYVHPMEKTSIAVFRHQFLNQEANFVWREPGTNYTEISVKLDAVTYGIGIGLKMTDTFSLGIAVNFDQLDYFMKARQYESLAFPESFGTVSDTTNAEHFTASLLWNPFGELNIGLVYRMGPEFETSWVTYSYDTADLFYQLKAEREQTLKIPDVYGIGISYRLLSNFTATLDANYIEYSDISDDYIDGTSPDPIAKYFEIEDQVEFRVGVEYILDIGETPVAVRAGYYYRPDHLPVYEGGPDPDFLRIFNSDRDEDDHIFSLGFGAVFHNFQIDVAGSAGDFIKEFTTSIVYRFD